MCLHILPENNMGLSYVISFISVFLSFFHSFFRSFLSILIVLKCGMAFVQTSPSVTSRAHRKAAPFRPGVFPAASLRRRGVPRVQGAPRFFEPATGRVGWE